VECDTNQDSQRKNDNSQKTKENQADDHADQEQCENKQCSDDLPFIAHENRPLGLPPIDHARASGAAGSSLIAARRADQPEHHDRDHRKADAGGKDRQHVIGSVMQDVIERRQFQCTGPLSRSMRAMKSAGTGACRISLHRKRDMASRRR
jgi:hypothetical protein